MKKTVLSVLFARDDVMQSEHKCDTRIMRSLIIAVEIIKLVGTGIDGCVGTDIEARC